jgi:hypothetical protein
MSGSGKTRGRMELTDRAIKAFKPDVEPYRWSDTRAFGLAAVEMASDMGLLSSDKLLKITSPRFDAAI